ncbi:Pyrroline-5-carboxylate reductase [Novipirellula galeiformis]|uniref:Pyrroline-5-carboxylate reductase n=1 Tax=Novipirellula galeiformis TaxID=2528004 RepID=A0A5C6CI49_9BACT|nr:pyrroline-5-carboxylate reductase [Novipirellula galeiformis]TWU23942.1 Pyrroline-5-carboxylate reductase [Novipirellula galeiformis]
MDNQRITVIGGGQMGRALVGGMLDNKVVLDANVTIVDHNATSRQWWQENRPNVLISQDLESSVQGADLVVLAVKPKVLGNVAKQAEHFWDGKLVVSIAAGVMLETLCGWIGHRRVVRVMPNTPCLVGQGACAYCVADEVSSDDEAQIMTVLSSVGMAFAVSESQMDGVTGLSGSGPAYVCLIIEALADGGVFAGLPRPLAMKLATQTVLGTAQMIAETGRHPGELKDSVASPAGTTIAAIRVLEQNGLRATMIDAVAASAQRSRELAKD